MCVVSEYVSNNVKDITVNCCFSEIFSTTKRSIKKKQVTS